MGFRRKATSCVLASLGVCLMLFASGQHTPPARFNLQKLLSEEVQDHAWEFSAKRIAEMLSAVGNGPSDILVSSTHKALDEMEQPRWPKTRKEWTWYYLIATFLNHCVDACHGALDGPQRSAARNTRWYDRLKFVVYDKPTEGGVGGAPPLKLDLEPGKRVAWSPKNPLRNRCFSWSRPRRTGHQ